MFTQTIAALKGGDTARALDAVLADVVKAVLKTGKAGAVTLALKIKIDDSGADAVAIDASVKAKIPAAPCFTTLFADVDGTLSHEPVDDKQESFPFDKSE